MFEKHDVRNMMCQKRAKGEEDAAGGEPAPNEAPTHTNRK
jgi:hypothetical protein